MVQTILPPTQFYIKHFHPGPKPHIGQAQQGQRYIVAKGMSPDALSGQSGKAGVDLRRKDIACVVLRDQGLGFTHISRRIQGSRRKQVDIDLVAGDIPIDFIGGGEVGHPCFCPALKSR